MILDLGGTAPLKLGRAKNVQNSAWFRKTFYFKSKYLWNGWSYRQGVNKHDLSGVEQKKFGNYGSL